MLIVKNMVQRINMDFFLETGKKFRVREIIIPLCPETVQLRVSVQIFILGIAQCKIEIDLLVIGELVHDLAKIP
jgi:hypothetical protein